MTANSLLWLLQANDSAYPSGSYAHSLGLEELVESGVVHDPASLESYFQKQVVPALLTFEIPYFVRCHQSASSGDSTNLLALDAELDAWRIPAELKDASRRVGSQRLALLAQLHPGELVNRQLRSAPRSHLLVVSALELAELPLDQAARAVAFQAIAGLTAASMKLLRIGQTSCQLIARRTMILLESKMDAALSMPFDGWFNPLLEIASLRHARAHARLFIS